MSAVPADLSRLCVHTITTRAWSLAQCLDGYARAGVSGITIWRQVYQDLTARVAGKMLRESGLRPVSLCRGGFFPADSSAERQAAIDDNLRLLDEAAELGVPLIVLVCGALPGLALEEARKQIGMGIEAILPAACERGIRLAVEPLHPMYAADRSAINTLSQANDLVERIDDPQLGVAVDVYHLWWDDRLEHEIARCGRRIFAFHVCDWRVPTRDLLNDRCLMGQGCIDLRRIRGWVEQAEFAGMIEVEIFSDELWALDPALLLEQVCAAYRQAC